MKKIILSCLATCALFHTANAQLTEKQLKSHLKDIAKSKEKGSVIWSYDTIYNQGVAYCIMKKKNKKPIGFYDGDFYALNGKNVFYARLLAVAVPSEFEVAFLATGQKGYISGDVVDAVVEAELFSGDSLNETAVNKFIMVHADKPEGSISKIAGRVGLGDDDSQNAAQPVRNRQAPILMFGNNAQQDFKKIGSIKQVFGVASANLLYEIFDASGRKIAEAEGKMHSTSWQVVTLKNNKAHSVSCAQFKEKEAIMEYLTQLRYL